MSEVAEKTAEVVAENVEEAVDGVVEVLEVTRNNPVLLGSVFVAGVVGGAGLGYFLAVKRLGKKFDERMEMEISETRAFYANLNKVDEAGEPLTPQDVMEQRHGAEAAAQIVRGYQGRSEEPEGEPEGEPYDEVVDEKLLAKTESKVRRTEKVETRNVFSDPSFDLEEELKYRTEDKPYILTHDEYFAAEKDYDTFSLTYYELDDTLVDEQDKPIENVDEMVGEDHLVRFGSGSKDNNIVYVRNDKLGSDYEISKSTGSYLEEVLGMPDEEPNSLKHSDQRDRRRAFQHGDE